MNNLDIATGNLSTLPLGIKVYSTTGTTDTLAVKQAPPPEASPTCYLYSFQSTCSKEQQAAVLGGRAVIKDYVLVDMKTKGNSNGDETGSGGGTPPKKNAAVSNEFVRGSVFLATMLAVGFVLLA
jgi:hypothetical protein